MIVSSTCVLCEDEDGRGLAALQKEFGEAAASRKLTDESVFEGVTHKQAGQTWRWFAKSIYLSPSLSLSLSLSPAYVDPHWRKKNVAARANGVCVSNQSSNM